MSIFLKIQLSAIIGSVADYLLTIILVEILGSWYVIANFSGNIIGLAIQFLLLKNWVFKENKYKGQLRLPKYILIVIGNLILCSLGIYLFTHLLKLNYLISKTVTSVLLGISYNYFMQTQFVFKAD
jgi:putative flippase GtrA